MRRSGAGLVLMLSALAISGCGGGAPSAACDYLTDAETGGILREPVRPGISSDEAKSFERAVAEIAAARLHGDVAS